MKLDQQYTEHSIRTYSGKVFDLTVLDPGTICIEDIAHALSFVPRFGGHLDKLYSVAQHSVMVAASVAPEFALEALLHDASEAYLGDMPSPIKKLLPDYKALESRVMEAIAAKFKINYPLSPEVKQSDREQLTLEWDAAVIDKTATYWTSEYAEAMFLEAFKLATLEVLRAGDPIEVGDGFKTLLDKIEYCPVAGIPLYWFYNEAGEYRYNVREFIKRA